MPGRVFLSYRRAAAQHLAGRLADRIVATFGPDSVFMDVDTIEPGADFHDVTSRAISSCAVLLAVIDPQWSDATDANGRRRLDNPHDLVVLEIAAALGRDVVVIPILIDGATMPAPDALPAPISALARRNAIRLDHESFASDSARLMQAIGTVLRPSPARPAAVPRAARGDHGWDPPDRRSAERTVPLPRVAPMPVPAAAFWNGGPPPRRAIPYHRRALLIVLWCLLFLLTVFTSVGFGLSLSANSTTGVGGSILVVIILGFGIFGIFAAIRAETRHQQVLVDRAGWNPHATAVSPKVSKALHISWATAAAGFFIMAVLFPGQA